jgi:hypothetical protein
MTFLAKANFGRLVLGAALTCMAAGLAGAQSAQKVSLQLSVLGTSIGTGSSGSASGIGLEPQLRFNHLARSETKGILSLGIGAQWTNHTSGGDELTISGVFLEPRWVPPVSFAEGRVFPYLAARLALLNQSNNFGTSSGGTAFGGGGGFAFVLGSRINLDVGGAIVSQSFDDFTYNDDGSTGSFRKFTSYAIKAGLSYGLGK